MIAALTAAGLREAEAAAKARLFADTDRLVASHFPADGRQAHDDEARSRWYVPGRIEVLGKHTDYAGGRSLLCAVERGFCVSAVARIDARLRIVDAVTGVEADLRVSRAQGAMPRWRNYPATVAQRVARNFPGGGRGTTSLRGADIAFASDLPRASGLSSSSALIVAIFSVLADVNRLAAHEAYVANIPDLDALASYLGCIENGRSFGTLAGARGVGTRGGSQDHLAIIGSEAGRLAACRFSPVRRERFVSLPEGHTFVIASSGVTATKTGDALERYNRASAAVGEVMRRWHQATGGDEPTLFDVIASGPEALPRLRSAIESGGGATRAATGAGGGAGASASAGADAGVEETMFTVEELLGRVEQFRIETVDVIPRATDALAAGDVGAFGALVDRSQQAATRFLGNQVPETIALAGIARAEGARAASAFGAGFGGSVWALVRAAEAEAFLERWRDAYRARFPLPATRAEFFRSGAGPGRLRLPARDV